MAENILWLRQQLPSGSRMMLWAHNAHISNSPGYMGTYLRTALGTDYVNAGFVFGTGSFNAVGPSNGLGPFTALQVPNASIESAFQATGKGLAFLDTRLVASGGPGASIYAGPLLMRNIGATYNPNQELSFFYTTLLPRDLNILIYVPTTSPSALLPYNP